MGKFYDLTGQQFGKLSVLRRSTEQRHGNARWECLCECGSTYNADSAGLRKGETTHCGCTPKIYGPKDITGQRFGRLVALDCTGEKNPGGNYIWNFQCDCGNKAVLVSGNVIFRGEGSCGCARSEKISNIKTTHGLSKSREYKSWCKAKERTRNPNCKSYVDYGAIGIGMCDEFYDSFEAFFQHIGEMPKDGARYTLGRIENQYGYVTGNVRWETDKQQARNKGFQVNNSSGFSGVTWDRKDWKGGSKLYAKAHWAGLDGVQRGKRFNVAVYGLMPAFRMACAYREKMIEELNKQGAGYSDSHGK